MSPTLCRCVLCLLGSALMCQVCKPATASVSGLLIHLEFFNFSAMFLCWKLCHICYAFGFVGIPYSKCFLYGLSAHCSPSALLARVKYFMVFIRVCKCLKGIGYTAAGVCLGFDAQLLITEALRDKIIYSNSYHQL